MIIMIITKTADYPKFTRVEFEIINNEAILKVVDGCEGTDFIIPSTVDMYPVTTIGESAFSWMSTLTFVNIPKSVKRICKEAFYECINLTSIIIPDSVLI